MAVGDGSAWDETTPVDATLVAQVDDYMRDVRIGVRGRMAFEHEWPSSQSATAEAGKHKFITLQNQATKPTVSGTQLAAVYTKTSGSGLQELFFENEAGTEVQLTSRANLNQQVLGSTGIIVGTSTTITTQFTSTDVAPTNTMGVQVLSIAYTPLSATHILEVDATVFVSGGGVSGQRIIGGLYRDTDAAAVAVGACEQASNDRLAPLPIFHRSAAGTTAAVTFKVRVGPIDAVSIYVNGTSGGRLFGGLLSSYLRVRELSLTA